MVRTVLVTILIVLGISLQTLAGSADSSEEPPSVVYVDDDFNPSTPGWNYTHFDSIGNAIAKVADGGKVYIFNGIYQERLVIDKSLELIGEDKYSTIISKYSITIRGKGNPVIKIKSDNVKISNLTVGYGCTGVVLYGNNNVISNCRVISNSKHGMVVWGGHNVVMNTDILFSGGAGIFLAYGSRNNTIVNNNISDNDGDGIYIESYDPHDTIEYNTISCNGRHGIYVAGNHIVIRNNTISSNKKHGIYVAGNHIVIRNNTISSNKGTGVYVNADCATIIDNKFSNDGLFIDHWSRGKHNITGNTVNEKPLVYFENKDNLTITHAGQVILYKCENITVKNLVVSNTDCGIELIGCKYCRIINCRVERCGKGIYAAGNHTTISKSNIVNNNGAGVILRGKFNTIENSIITYNGGDGVRLLYESRDNTIKNNEISNNNGSGISIEYSDTYRRATIESNIISSNGKHGIYVAGNHAVIRNNTISSNKKHGVYVKAKYATIIDNKFSNDGLFIDHRSIGKHNITGNTVNGKPLVYLENKDNLTITHAGQVILFKCENITVKNLVISDTDCGIYLRDCKYCKVTSCRIERCGKGIYVAGNHTTISKSNIVNNNGAGVTLKGKFNAIEDNTITYNSGVGVHLLYKSRNNTIKNNEISNNNGSGIHIDYCSYSPYDTYDTIVEYNTISYNGKHGICVGGSHAVIRNNTISSNKGNGVYLYTNTKYATIIDNKFSNDGLFIDHRSIGKHNITGNTVNGKPLVYLENKDNLTITHAGQVILYKCENITVKNLVVSDTDCGIELRGCKYCRIINCRVERCGKGIYAIGHHITISKSHIVKNDGDGVHLLDGGRDNVIKNNEISNNNGSGIHIDYCSYNPPDTYDTIEYNIISSNGKHGIHVGRNYVVVRENTISYNGKHGIYVFVGNHAVIGNNTISSNKGTGVYVCAKYVTIIDNKFSNDGLFIDYLDPGKHNITGNTVNGKPLVYLENKDNLTITHAGQVILYKCKNITVKNLVISNTDYGMELIGCKYCTITNNLISSCHTGILLYTYCKNNQIYENIIKSNERGITVAYSPGLYSSGLNSIYSNTIVNNHYGIYMKGFSRNLIYNNYLQNRNNANDTGNNIWNIGKIPGTNIVGGSYLGGNYWSDYTGLDIDGDGIGDTNIPHNSSGGIKHGGDYLPLILPGGNGNSPPSTPTKPVGETDGEVGNVYTFETSSIDPDGDEIRYGWDWDGDFVVDEWTGYHWPNTTISVNHIWTEEGVYRVRVKAEDIHGLESEWSDYLEVHVSPASTPFSTVYDIIPSQPNGINGWYTTDVTISFTVINSNASNYISTFYSIDGSDWQIYTSPIKLCDEGVHIIRFYSVDQYANTSEPVKNLTIKIDKTPPHLSVDSPKSGCIYIFGIRIWERKGSNAPIAIGGIKISVNTTDKISGIEKVEFLIADKSKTICESPYQINVRGRGRITVKIISYNKAGLYTETEPMDIILIGLGRLYIWK